MSVKTSESYCNDLSLSTLFIWVVVRNGNSAKPFHETGSRAFAERTGLVTVHATWKL